MAILLMQEERQLVWKKYEPFKIITEWKLHVHYQILAENS